MKQVIVVLLLAGLSMIVSGIASAQDQAVHFSTEEIYCLMWYSGYYGDFGFNHGLAIRAEEDVEVVQLGVFDSTNTIFDPHYGLVASTEVGIYSFPDGEEIYTTRIQRGSTGTVVGEWRYFDIDPVILTAGSEYMMVRWQRHGSVEEGDLDIYPDMQEVRWWDTMERFDAAELLAPEFTMLPGWWYSYGTDHIDFPTFDGGGDGTPHLGAMNFRYNTGVVRVETRSLSAVKALFR